MGKIPGLAAKAAAEFVGTFTVGFMGCGSVMIAERFPGSSPHDAAPVVFGLAVASMIYALGHISGAHFNPAVSLAFALTRRLPLKQVAGYWAAQFLGAIAATGLLVLLLPHGDSLGQTTPHVDSLRAFGWEVVLTFFFDVRHHGGRH